VSALAVLALVQLAAVGQEPPGRLASWEWGAPTFDVLGMAEGLSHASVTAILEDRDGFIWLGTQDGLNRFDGHDFLILRHSPVDPSTLADDFIEAIAQDPEGAIWVGTNRGGLARLAETGVQSFPLEELGPRRSARSDRGREGLAGRSVFAIEPDEGDRLILGTDAGVAHLDLASGRATLLEGMEPITAQAVLRRADSLWVGNTTGTIARYRRLAGGSWGLAEETSIPTGALRFAYHDSTLFVGATTGGVWALDPGSLEEREGFGSIRGPSWGPVRALVADRNGRLWIGSTPGVAIVNLDSRRVTRYVHDPDNDRGLPHEIVRAIHEDRSGSVWIGTWSGLARLPRLHAAFLRIPVGTEAGLSAGVAAISTGPGETLLLGTLGGGIDRLDTSGRMSRYPPDPDDPRRPSGTQVFDIRPDGAGGAWLATFGGAINHLSPDGTRFERYTLRALAFGGERNAPSVYVDHSGRVYAGTVESGLQELVPGTNRFEPARGPDGPWDLGSDYAWPMTETPDGTLWIGAHGGGLNRLSPDRSEQRRWTTADGLSDDRTLTVFADSQGYVWIGTEGGGLNRFDPRTETFRVYTTADGLPHDNVQAVLEDRRGFLWISTNDGLARFDRTSEEFWTFREASGLAGNRFFANAAYEDEHGLLYFGGADGLTVVDPALIEKSSTPPRVALTGLSINDAPVPASRATAGGRGLDLDFEERFFTLTFAALDFTDPEQNRYQYLLDPLQAEWVDVGDDNVATYTSVPPGRYTFRVRARNSEGVWNESGLVIPVRVRTPWWQAWWFRASVVGIIALMISALYSYRLQQIRSREALRLKIAGQLHDDIGANLSALQLKAELAKSAAGIQPSDTKRLEDIARLARESAHKVRETVWVVNTSYDTMSGIVAKMQDTLDVMLDGRMKPSFTAPATLPTIPVAMELRQDVYLVYKELLQNVVKHSNASAVAVEVGYSAPILTLVVRDDGDGFDVDRANLGNGLGSMRRRAERHKGKLRLESRIGEGTVARLDVPMR
jgi:ligand-binding sensor domain-containing protein/signal transduction histidine kinase